jgi:hypothetical protein
MCALALDEITVEGAIVTAAVSAADLSELTTKSLTGTGAFDVLMETTRLHLVREYEDDRITKDEYATVYLGAMQSVLQSSVQFLANHRNNEKILAEIGLIRQKTVTELAQTDDTLPADALGFNGSTAIEGLVKLQKDAVEQDILVKAQQVLNAIEEVALTQQKVVTELAQTDDDLSGLPADYGYNNTHLAVEGVVGYQALKSKAELEHIQQKTVTEIANVSDALPNGYAQTTNTVLQGLAAAQKLKTEAEVDLLAQKSVSELAQTYDTIPSGVGLETGGYAVSGVIGKQKLLFAKQTDGFDRDAEQKLAKIMVDSWIAQIAADPGTVVTSSGLHNANIGSVIALAQDGIGDTYVPEV